jgi:hypothetical protein
MKAMYLASALLLSALTFSPASAAPAVPTAALTVQSPVILAQMDRDRYDRREHRERYRAGHRYHTAPHGWHRYDRRPHDWNRRGCILVGPIWFCP